MSQAAGSGSAQVHMQVRWSTRAASSSAARCSSPAARTEWMGGLVGSNRVDRLRRRWRPFPGSLPGCAFCCHVLLEQSIHPAASMISVMWAISLAINPPPTPNHPTTTCMHLINILLPLLQYPLLSQLAPHLPPAVAHVQIAVSLETRPPAITDSCRPHPLHSCQAVSARGVKIPRGRRRVGPLHVAAASTTGTRPVSTAIQRPEHYRGFSSHARPVFEDGPSHAHSRFRPSQWAARRHCSILPLASILHPLATFAAHWLGH